MIRKAHLLSIPLALSACASVGDDAQADRLASAKLVFANGQAAGTAELTGAGNKVSLVIALAGVTPGPHGIHLHAVGRCEAPAFTTAGGHLNPGSKQHGTDNPMGSHLGDLPNIEIAADGTGSLTVALDGAREQILSDVFDADGTAIVLHAGPDDYKTDPAGNSGGRIACGVLQRG